jgi:hypothetical protein
MWRRYAVAGWLGATPRQHENIVAFVDATTGAAVLTIADAT